MAYQSPTLALPSTSGWPLKRTWLTCRFGATNGSNSEFDMLSQAASASTPTTKLDAKGCQLQPTLPPATPPEPSGILHECEASTRGAVKPPEKAANDELPTSVNTGSIADAPPMKPPT